MNPDTSPLPHLGHDFATHLPELCVPARPRHFPDPQLIACNDEHAEELGLDPDWLRSDAGVRFLCGATLPDGAHPVAQGYAGHQFGSLSPRLGDGRALLLGEIRDPAGTLHDLHLKGSGRTVWARGGDGLCPLEAALKEFAFSNFLHAIGVPSTRVLAVINTGDTVHRTTPERGGLVVRVAASHLRVGTFQYAALLDVHKFRNPTMPLTRKVADYAISRHYPELAGQSYLEFFRTVVTRHAELVAAWMRFGFIHGVLNTDNVSIAGETIDFGPCAFMDYFDPATVYSSIDTANRYAYNRQPGITAWNLARLGETLVALVEDPSVPEQPHTPNNTTDAPNSAHIATEHLTTALQEFPNIYVAAYRSQMSQALGIRHLAPTDQDSLIDGFTTLLTDLQPDYTATLRALAEFSIPADTTSPHHPHLSGDAAQAWLRRWWATRPNTAEMRASNPAVIPRNHALKDAMRAVNDGGPDPPATTTGY